MALTAHLFANVTVEFTNSYCRDVEYDAEVDYTYDGDDLRITAIKCAGMNGYDDDIVADLVWDAINDICDEAYAEWLEDYHAARADAAYEAMCEREAAE